MAKEPNLIKKHMLDSQLREEIDSMAKTEDVRAKADAITLDDLDPDVRARVLNNPVSPNAYDDTDLRNRVITLESAKMDANIAFNKNTDVVTREMLNQDLQQVTDAARNVVNKIDADIVENGYRKLSVPIEESDMSEDFQDKFTRTIQKVNNLSIDSSNVAGVTEQIAVLREDVATLSRDKISIEYGNEHYRLSSEPIPITELETNAQEAINGIGTINETLQNKANTSYVDGHFRRTDVAITKNDLDINLKSDIDIAARAANDVRDAAEAVIDSYYFETILPSFITTYGTTASVNLTYAHPTTENIMSTASGKITLSESLYSEHYGHFIAYDEDDENPDMSLDDLNTYNDLIIRNYNTNVKVNLQDAVKSIVDNEIQLKGQYASTRFRIDYKYADITDNGQRIAFQNKTSDEQVDLYLNYVYPYSFYHKVAASAGTLNLPNTDNRAGKATFTAFFNWVYEQLQNIEERLAALEENNG